MAIYNENGVPLLHNLSNSSREFVEGKHSKAVEAEEKLLSTTLDPDTEEAAAQREEIAKHYLLGESVVVHNKVPVGGINVNSDGSVTANPDAPTYTAFSIGHSTLQEALTEVIGAFDTVHLATSDHIDTPDWVASTNKDLARLLAEHWGAKVRDIAEVVA